MKVAVEKIRSISSEISISIQGIHIATESGWFTKSSKGGYSIQVVLNDIGLFGQVLAIIVELKNVNLHGIEWLYNEDEAKLELISKAMIAAKKKAEVMINAVGYTISGIQSCSDSYEIPSSNIFFHSPINQEQDLAMRSRRATNTVDLGTEIRGRKEITAIASIEFIVRSPIS